MHAPQTAVPRAPERTPTGAPPPEASVTVSVAPSTIEAAVDLVRATPDTTWLILVSTAESWEQSTALATRARAASLHNRVLLHRSGLSPLGVRALVEAASALRSRLSPAQFLTALTVLEGQIRCFAVLPSVARLRDPSPSIVQHMLGWWPSTRFLVETGAAVRRVRQPFTLDGFEPAGAGSVLMHGGAADDRAGGILADVRTAFGTATTLERAAESDGWWGSDPILDLCLVPGDLTHALRTASADTSMCPWCREPAGGAICPLCHSTSVPGGRA